MNYFDYKFQIEQGSISNFYQRLNDVVGEMIGIKQELEESKDIDAICLSNQFEFIINNIKLALEKLGQIDSSI